MSVTHCDNGELSIKLDNLTFRGKSIGGRETSIMVEELSLVFDLGYQPDKIESIRNVLISHGHTDHIGCLHFCQINRKLKKTTLPWQIILPKCYIPALKVISTAFSSLNRGGYPHGFFDCQFDDEIEIKKTIKPFNKLFVDQLIEAENCSDIPFINQNGYFITAYPMKHKITSYGYVIKEKRKKLKKEYIGLTGLELKNLRQSGILIEESIEIPTIAFTGDTIIDSVLNTPDFLKSKILIMECTHFNDSSIEEAIEHGHIHFQQIVENIVKFENKWIILCHLSQKYRNFSDIEDYLSILSIEDRQRIIIWLS
jgi:ribonuclease Z